MFLSSTWLLYMAFSSFVSPVSSTHTHTEEELCCGGLTPDCRKLGKAVAEIARAKQWVTRLHCIVRLRILISDSDSPFLFSLSLSLCASAGLS